MSDDRRSACRYALEADLVGDFSAFLDSGSACWGEVQITYEFDYVGGYTDVVALSADGELLAFEAKLRKWREALHQAYRTRCFANRSYVVLPERTARIALQHEQEFRRRRVGLCAISDRDRVHVLIEVESDKPMQPWLAARALGEFGEGATLRECQSTTSRRPRTKSVPQDR